jgi:hypothetical protein
VALAPRARSVAPLTSRESHLYGEHTSSSRTALQNGLVEGLMGSLLIVGSARVKYTQIKNGG